MKTRNDKRNNKKEGETETEKRIKEEYIKTLVVICRWRLVKAARDTKIGRR